MESASKLDLRNLNKINFKAAGDLFFFPTPRSETVQNSPRLKSSYSTSKLTNKIQAFPSKSLSNFKKVKLKPLEIYAGSTLPEDKFNQTKTDFNMKIKHCRIKSDLCIRPDNIENTIRCKLSPIERKYLSSHVSPIRGVHRCSKDHLISTQYRSFKFANRYDFKSLLNQDYVKAYIEFYQSEPVLLQYNEDKKRKLEKNLFVIDKKDPYMSVSYSVEKAKLNFIKNKPKVWH